MSKTLLQYIPHGVPSNKFYKVTDEPGLARLAELRTSMDLDVEFVLMYNNRNIRRKMPSDIILAYRKFLHELPEDKRDGCRLLLHTQPIDENGTDLHTVARDIAPDAKIIFSSDRIHTDKLNDLYNISDVVINIANAEGFGLGTLEAIMAEKMIIATVTGGLQDQMGFRDENDDLLDPDVHFSETWGSNHDGKYTSHGEWVLPCFPHTNVLIGSPPTPYIFEDHVRWQEVADKIRQAYDMGKEERARRGALGREYAIERGMTSEVMGQRFIEGIEATLANFTPRKQFTLTQG